MMRTLVEGIKSNRFLVLGRAGIDFFATPIGVKSEHAATFEADLGGSSANICAGICKLGGQAALATSVSDDAVGRFCINKLKHYGVDTQYVRSVGGECRTSLAVYESVVENFQNVIYRNDAADFQVTEADVDKLDLAPYGAMIATGTNFAAEPSRSATFKAFDRARAAGMPVIFDIDYRPYSWPSAEVASDVLTRAGQACDMIVGNDEEFGFMAGDFNQGMQKARQLADSTAAIVIYKMGEKGAITYTADDEVHTGIYPVEAVKPNGAGDSFMAGMLTGIAQGLALEQAVLRGSACASIVVSKPGCAPALPDAVQLEQFLATHTATAPA